MHTVIECSQYSKLTQCAVQCICTGSLNVNVYTCNYANLFLSTCINGNHKSCQV